MAGVVVVVVIPVLGFTLNQIALTSKGREIAKTVDEILKLKASDATAFTQPFAVLIRGLSVAKIYSAWQISSRPGVVERPPSLQASAPISLAPRAAKSQPPTLTVGVGEAGTRARAQAPTRARTQRAASEYGGVHADRIPPIGLPAMPSFWQALTATEKRALMASARQWTFVAGTVLCRQDQPADHVIVIRSGWVRVCRERGGVMQFMAERGPGDIVGERAALLVRSRSATVVAIAKVRAMVVTTDDFAAFLDAHPRVLEVLERLIYSRLTEDRGDLGQEAGSHAWSGQNCSIFLTDITAFGSDCRDDEDRRAVRDLMNGFVQEAFESSGVPWLTCHREDRGDGTLIVVPPATPTRSVVDPMLAHLAAALGRHNHQASNATRIQLRAALDVGPVVADATGVSGQAIIHAARMLGAAPLRKRLAETAADLGFVASTFVYDSVIKQRPGGVDPASYQQVVFRAKESRVTAWIHVAGSGAECRTS